MSVTYSDPHGLRRLRLKLGITCTDMAAILNISRNHLVHLERFGSKRTEILPGAVAQLFRYHYSRKVEIVNSFEKAQ